MAGIDKTYIDGNEYLQYRQWWIDNYDKMIKELSYAIYLYTFQVFPFDVKVTPEFLKQNTDDIKEYSNKYDFPIWNTSEKEDKWLIKNCDILSFRKRMLEVYPHNWKGFKNQKWIPRQNIKPKYKRNNH